MPTEQDKALLDVVDRAWWRRAELDSQTQFIKYGGKTHIKAFYPSVITECELDLSGKVYDPETYTASGSFRKSQICSDCLKAIGRYTGE